MHWKMKLFEIVLNKAKEDLCQTNVRYVRVATEREVSKYRVSCIVWVAWARVKRRELGRRRVVGRVDVADLSRRWLEISP